MKLAAEKLIYIEKPINKLCIFYQLIELNHLLKWKSQYDILQLYEIKRLQLKNRQQLELYALYERKAPIYK